MIDAFANSGPAFVILPVQAHAIAGDMDGAATHFAAMNLFLQISFASTPGEFATTIGKACIYTVDQQVQVAPWSKEMQLQRVPVNTRTFGKLIRRP